MRGQEEGRGNVYPSHKVLICFDYLVWITGWAVGEKKGNVEQEFAQNGTASIPLLKLRAIRLVRHRAKIKATLRMCGMKATRKKHKAGQSPPPRSMVRLE